MHALIEIYNYLACMASITSDKAPEIFGRRLATSGTNPEATNEHILHPLFGISVDLYETLTQINKLASRQVHANPADFQSEAREIELRLQSWQPPPVEDSRQLIEARAVGFALQWAIIMCLLQVTKRMNNGDAQMRKGSDNILSALSLIRPGSEMEARMLFPLFMAGVCSMTKASRLTVEYRLNAMETTIGFGNIFVAHRLLDEVWRLSNQHECVNWEELKERKYPGLVLF